MIDAYSLIDNGGGAQWGRVSGNNYGNATVNHAEVDVNKSFIILQPEEASTSVSVPPYISGRTSTSFSITYPGGYRAYVVWQLIEIS